MRLIKRGVRKESVPLVKGLSISHTKLGRERAHLRGNWGKAGLLQKKKGVVSPYSNEWKSGIIEAGRGRLNYLVRGRNVLPGR